MKPGDDGRLQASVDSKTPVRFRVEDLETNEAIDLWGAEAERGEDGGYGSVASPVDGRVVVSVDASDSPPQRRPSSLHSSPAMSVAAQTSTIFHTLAVERDRAVKRALSAGPDAPVDTKARDDAEDFFARAKRGNSTPLYRSSDSRTPAPRVSPTTTTPTGSSERERPSPPSSHGS